jgi:hypothetical protein
MYAGKIDAEANQRTSLWIAILAGSAAMVSAISDAPIAAVAALFAFLSLSVAIYVNFVKPALRAQILKGCVSAYFIVPTTARPCAYARQDDEEHRLKELSLKPNTEVVIDLIMLSQCTFAFSEVQVGFMGELERKPHILKYTNRFIRFGKHHEIDPSNADTEDYVDVNLSYHRVGSRLFSADSTRSLAFTVRTNKPGVYPLKIQFGSDEHIGAVGNLYVTVEEDFTVKQRCVLDEHVRRGRACSEGIAPPA